MAKAGWQEYIAENNDVGKDGWVREFAAMMKPLPKKLDKTLEVGCSGGRWIRWYMRRHKIKEAHGIDIYDVTKIHGKGKYGKPFFKFKKGDARKLPYKSNDFDFVYSLGLVEHFKDRNDVQKILNEQARVLKKGGYIVTTFPTLNLDSLGYWRVKILEDPFHDYKHYNTTINEITAMYRKAGLKVLSAKHLGWFFEPHGIPRFTNARQLSQIVCIVGKKAQST